MEIEVHTKGWGLGGLRGSWVRGEGNVVADIILICKIEIKD
jgi:hypothetical protein